MKRGSASQKEAGAAVLMSDNVDFRAEKTLCIRAEVVI